MKKKVKKVKVAKKGEKVPVKVKKKVEITPLNKKILWLLASDSRTTGEIRDELNVDREVAKTELAKLVEGDLVSGGGYLKGHELTEQGNNLLGSEKIKLDTHINTNKIKSGNHTILTVSSKNIGDRPIDDAALRITSPRFINISRHGSKYSRDKESFVLEFPVDHLNPSESQMKIFDLRGELTDGTIVSRYKVLVDAIVAGKLKDRKEITIAVEK